MHTRFVCLAVVLAALIGLAATGCERAAQADAGCPSTLVLVDLSRSTASTSVHRS